jgi:hypothetical protein
MCTAPVLVINHVQKELLQILIALPDRGDDGILVFVYDPIFKDPLGRNRPTQLGGG